ncbi:hypothetical protein MBLNU13_g03325t1 [Cladosporium sp. NU13]
MISRSINNVTVAGITGAIGPSIIHSLNTAGFRVQALTRRRQTISIPDKANIVEVNYNDDNALRKALRHQDAVVSCLGDVPAAVQAQESLLKASLAAGVKRFVPSEFGSNTTNRHVMSYSLLITGPFIDWGLSKVPFIINVGASTAEGNGSCATVIDGGNTPFSITRTTTVGNSVAAVLTRPHETKNRALFIHEGITTQNKLIALAQKSFSFAGDLYEQAPAFSITNINSVTAEQAAWKAFHYQASDPTEWALPFVNLSLWSRRELCHFAHTDNELLGIRALRGAELETLLREEIEKAANAFDLIG